MSSTPWLLISKEDVRCAVSKLRRWMSITTTRLAKFEHCFVTIVMQCLAWLKTGLKCSKQGLGTFATTLPPLARKTIKRIREARKFWLFLAEVAGVVLVAFGISMWSVPAAIIIGGLVLVAAVEVRPRVVQTMPSLPVPDELLHQQAERAAQVINNVRFGLPVVDEKALSRLSRDECERVIQAARAIGAKQQ